MILVTIHLDLKITVIDVTFNTSTHHALKSTQDKLHIQQIHV